MVTAVATNIQMIMQNEKNNFLSHHHLDDHERKVFNYLTACGTSTFGFNAYRCKDCGHTFIHYNSCGNRHCPSCQCHSREEWIDRFSGFLLDIPYYHIVFTVPDTLNDIFMNNKEKMYNLLFKTSSQSLLQASERLYGQIGFTSILHTGGQNLWFHPHVHMIVSGGGLSHGENGEFTFKKAPANFLVSVKVLSRLFRGKFIDSMKKLDLLDENSSSIDFDSEPYRSLVNELYSKEWVVYSKKPFGSNQAILNYIGRYSHRVAISNSRILDYSLEDHTVTFSYKDYRDHSKQKRMTLDALEFLRRFMMHILPSRFVKIRHYGFMSNSNRKVKIPLCRKCLNQTLLKADPEDCDLHPRNKNQCPKCSGKVMKIFRFLPEKPVNTS